MAALAAPAALVERAAIVALVARAAVGQAGLAALVVWVSRASAVLAASGAWVAPDGMRVVSPMARLVVMRALAAPVASAELRARLAPTLRPCSVAPAEPAGMRARRARVLRV
jgi:hypothetical protein